MPSHGDFYRDGGSQHGESRDAMMSLDWPAEASMPAWRGGMRFFNA